MDLILYHLKVNLNSPQLQLNPLVYLLIKVVKPEQQNKGTESIT